MLPKYSAKNWPVGQPVPAVTVKVTTLEPRRSGLLTVIDTEPAVLMSLAGMAAVSWLALTNVVGRLLPFQFTVEPTTKPLPLTVREKAPLPAAAEDGVSALMAGGGVVPPSEVRHAP